MLRVILLTTLTAAFVYRYESVLLSRNSLLGKMKRIPIQTSIFAVLAVATIFGFRDAPEVVEPQAVEQAHGSDVETTAAVAQPVLPDPLQPKDAAAACVEHALKDARDTEDLVAETWLSSVEGFLETAPGEVTVQMAVGPRTGSAKGPHCRSEARLTCAFSGRDVKPITPLHMTGSQIACQTAESQSNPL